MKKAFSMLLLLAVSGALTPTNLHAGAFDQLMDTSRDSEAATREPTDEGARYGASQGFDTDSSTPVDLSGKENGVVDPNDLKQYDPPQPSLHINPPPPL
jgi:hypothetical protein